MNLSTPLPPALRLLLDLLAAPQGAPGVGLGKWEGVIRYARNTGLLAVLDARLAREGVLDRIPDRVAAHLESGRAVARHRRQMLLWEIDALTRALRDFGGPVVLLKGGAYLAQDLTTEQGRLVSDIDLMVSRARIDEVERLLLSAGWQHEVDSDYDQRYYREWSHELPPMRIPGHVLGIDLHHTITPVTGRLRPDPSRLFARAVPIAGSRFLALGPPDQLLHVAIHLFQDSDLDARLRELVDFDSLARSHGTEPAFWPEVESRAQELGFQRPLWYAARYARAWLRTPVPEGIATARGRPPAPAVALMDRLVRGALLPHRPDGEPPFAVRLSRRAMLARYHWLRMPPRLLLPHLLRKALRGTRPAPEG